MRAVKHIQKMLRPNVIALKIIEHQDQGVHHLITISSMQPDVICLLEDGCITVIVEGFFRKEDSGVDLLSVG